MSTDRTAGTYRCRSVTFQLVSRRFNWIIWPSLFIAALLHMIAGADAYPLIAPDESRHAGIVHDMWAARQYLMPRVDGFPVLDGAPLHYWVSLAFLTVFGAHEWTLRLPSAIAAGVLLVFFVRIFLPATMRRLPAVFCVALLFLLHPALLLGGRFASPDMLNLLLLTMANGAFLQASRRMELGLWSGPWTFMAWMATALLGLGAGPLAPLLPVLTIALWLCLRRRFDIMAGLCWWPGIPSVVLLLLPWLLLAQARYPGIINAILQEQAVALVGGGRYGWAQHVYGMGWVLLLAGALPLAVCLYRFRDAELRASLRNPLAGLMALWLLVVVLLHSLMVSSLAGYAMATVMPLLYFAAVAVSPGDRSRTWVNAAPWLVFLATAGAVATAGALFFSQRLSEVPPLAQILRPYYNTVTDKAIMLDRFDYGLNFYLGTSKLVFVAANWLQQPNESMPRWQRELAMSARFVPNTADRMLLDTRAAPLSIDLPGPPYDDLVNRLCGPRVVNLWVIAAPDAPERYPILQDLTPYVMTGRARAWYLPVTRTVPYCQTWGAAKKTG